MYSPLCIVIPVVIIVPPPPPPPRHGKAIGGGGGHRNAGHQTVRPSVCPSVCPSVTKFVSAITSDFMHRFTQYLTQWCIMEKELHKNFTLINHIPTRSVVLLIIWLRLLGIPGGNGGPLQNFNRSHVMVIGRSVLFSDPARPPGGGVGRPKHPKIPPPPPPRKINFCLHAFQNPRNIFEKKNLLGVLRPQEHFLAKKKIQFNIPPPPPPPHLHAPAQSSEHSPQSSCNNK